jgi:3-methyl-2-oxobutanoate hydroxymethyltransferase
MPMAQCKEWTAPRLRDLKGRQKVVMLTAYDCATARLLDEAGVHAVLVGDSLGMTALGYATTVPVTVADILHHTAAVARGVRRALVIADMPFLSYQVSIPQALENAGRLVQQGGADAVKLEGGEAVAPAVHALVANGIPVLGHIGLLPQHVHATGGYKVRGRTPEEADQLRRDARALGEAGAFAIVLEGMPAALAGEITAAVRVPTIGIGAGPACDGQVLVVNDLLGLSGEQVPKFVRRYADLESVMREAFCRFRKDVEAGAFPGPEHCY